MKIASVWNPKGGQGKSILALNLAAAAVFEGLQSVVIDQDPQGTSVIFSQSNALPFDVLPEIPTDAPDCDLVLIDHMANDRSMPRPPLLVMPLIPKRSQYSAYRTSYELALRSGKKIITVAMNGDRRRPLERDLIFALKRQGALEIRASGVFSRADNEYRTIFDSLFDHVYGISDRRRELKSVLTAIMES